MYDTILFPTDGGEQATPVLEYVLDVAADRGATVHLLYVADTRRDSVATVGGEVVDALEAAGERAVAAATDRASERGVETVGEVLQGDPHRTIVDYANRYGVDLIAMPTHGRRGVKRFLLGSVTEKVVRTADVPVLTARPDGEFTYPYRDVLVPTDGSDAAGAALALGTDAAAATGATLHVLHVVDTTGLGIDVRSAAEAALTETGEAVVEEAVGTARETVDDVTGTVEHGSVAGTVRDYVEEHGVDLVVVGTHGRTGLERYLLGSVAETLVRTAGVPVLTVREVE